MELMQPVWDIKFYAIPELAWLNKQLDNGFLNHKKTATGMKVR